MTERLSARLHIGLLVAVLFAYGLLVVTLDDQSIWWDEGISLHLSTLPWREIAQDRAANIHAPLYFFALKVWTSAAGTTPFAGRYLSALAATLLPAFAYRFLGRRFGGRTGRAAALLVSLAPPFLVYGQEIRAYAMLPLGVLGLYAFAWPPDALDAGRWDGIGAEEAVADARSLARSAFGRGLVLGVLQACLVGLHYSGLIAAGVAAVVYGLRWLRHRYEPRGTRIAAEWLTGAATAALLGLPWVATVLGVGLDGLVSQAGIGNYLAEPVPAGYVADLLGIFHTTGLPQALSAPQLVRIGDLTADLMVLGSLMVLVRGGTGSKLGRLLLLWLMPFASAPAIWLLSPQSHPRYLYAFVIGGWLVVAALVTHPRLVRPVRSCLLAIVLVSSVLGLRAYLSEPTFARSDVRGAASFIREAASSGDFAIAPGTDWSLSNYDLGQATFVRAPSASALARGGFLDDVAPPFTVFALDYARGALDPQGALRAWLSWGGMLVSRRGLHGVFVEQWDIRRRPSLPSCAPISPVCVSGQALCLSGVGYQSDPVSGDALPIALCWDRPEASSADDRARLSVSLRLYGPAGNRVEMRDDLLLDALRRPTDSWPAQRAVSYHRLPIPVGSPPLAHTLELGVYAPRESGPQIVLTERDGRPLSSIVLGEVVPAATPWVDRSLYDTVTPPDGLSMRLSGALRLEGARLEPLEVQAGTPLYVTVAWGVTGDAADTAAPHLELVQDGHLLSTTKSARPFSHVPAGRPLVETLALWVPLDAPGGLADVVLVAGAQKTGLGTVGMVGEVHTYDAPPVEVSLGWHAGDVAVLVGADLASMDKVAPGEPVTLTLFWRAGPEAGERDLKVFTHLVSESGGIVAQHDGLPSNWTRPTIGWVAGEIIEDAHSLEWSPTGIDAVMDGERLILRIGLYEGSTGQRVVWDDGKDFQELPLSLTVVKSPPD